MMTNKTYDPKDFHHPVVLAMVNDITEHCSGIPTHVKRVWELYVFDILTATRIASLSKSTFCIYLGTFAEYDYGQVADSMSDEEFEEWQEELDDFIQEVEFETQEGDYFSQQREGLYHQEFQLHPDALFYLDDDMDFMDFAVQEIHDSISIGAIHVDFIDGKLMVDLKKATPMTIDEARAIYDALPTNWRNLEENNDD
jgi:hypothetical protein